MKFIKTRFLEIHGNQSYSNLPPPQATEAQAPPKKKMKAVEHSDLYYIEQSLQDESDGEEESGTEAYDDEVDKYKKITKPGDNDFQILKFWEGHEELKVLRIVALQILSVPASAGWLTFPGTLHGLSSNVIEKMYSINVNK
ncbi:zinc finger BED domain-containing protein 1-like [Sergentomyia squamirostris]